MRKIFIVTDELPINTDKHTSKALDELSELFSYLRVWKIEKHIYIDSLMPPTEYYHRDLFFQVELNSSSWV